MRDARPSDAGRDVGADAGAPCRLERAVPIEPLEDDEPDVPPGRPSARADTLGWLDPPAPAGTSCCDVRSVVTERVGCLGDALVARGTDRWGVVSARIRDGGELDVAFLGIGAGSGLPALVQPFPGAPRAMAGGNHRFAVLTANFYAGWPPPPRTGTVAVLDEGGAPRVHVPFPGGHIGRAIARVPAVHGWAAVTAVEDDAPSESLVLLDESLATLHSFELTRGAPDSAWSTPVAIGDRVVVVGVRESALVARVVSAPAGTDLGEHVVFAEPAFLHIGMPLGAAAARDAVVVVFGSGTSYAISFDPFSLEPGLPAVRVVSHRPPATALWVAADDVGSTVGVCVQSATPGAGPGPASFFVIDTGGRLLGRTLELDGDADLGCRVAVTGLDTYEVLHGAAEPATGTQRWTRTTLTVRR